MFLARDLLSVLFHVIFLFFIIIIGIIFAIIIINHHNHRHNLVLMLHVALESFAQDVFGLSYSRPLIHCSKVSAVLPFSVCSN